MAAKSLLIVQHLDWEGPGQHLLAALLEGGITYRVVEAWQEPLPALDPFGGMIVLGGSPNVDEEEQFPYLIPLKARIREGIAAGKAYLGFCLGHQLLAHVLGCRVGPLPQKSVGFTTGELTPAGMAHPVFQGLPAKLNLFKWHGQGVLPPLPPGSVSWPGRPRRRWRPWGWRTTPGWWACSSTTMPRPWMWPPGSSTTASGP